MTPPEAQSPETAKPTAGFRAGFVSLLGWPNVGKSTLMNRLLGFDLAIVSHKPQTTRDRINGIYSDEKRQIVFVDVPGVMEPRDKFNECLRDNAVEAMEGADAVYHLIDAAAPAALPPLAADALDRFARPVFLVVNKIDAVAGGKTIARDCEAQGGCAPGDELFRKWRNPADLPFNLERVRRVFFVSALQGFGLGALLEATHEVLPESPPLYDPEQLTDRTMRFLAAEAVRQKVLECTEQEIPYAVATRTVEFLEREQGKHRIRVEICVEHPSQKGIIIGREGIMLREIGSRARPVIEEIVGGPVYLELWVKVKRNWRKREGLLREFGYRAVHPRRPQKR